MTITIREAAGDEIDLLIPLLVQAEPSEGALRWSLAHLSDTAYRMDDEGQVIGAATMRWRSEPCEIVELAIALDRHGQGLGKQFVAWLVAEARGRGKREVLVGTGSASAGNIIFYQKCGFRMDHVRKDYFWYYDEPIYEHGIRVLDMLVFRYDLSLTSG
jgi:N-acetylglutamate synthase-like GNAT family acetyltransferase